MKFNTITTLLVLSLYATSTYAQDEPQKSWNKQSKKGVILIPKWETDSVYTLHITDITTDRSVGPQKIDTASYDLICKMVSSSRANYDIQFTYTHVKISKTSSNPIEHLLASIEDMPFNLNYKVGDEVGDELTNNYGLQKLKAMLKKSLDELIKAEPKDSYLAQAYTYLTEKMSTTYIIELLCEHFQSYIAPYGPQYHPNIQEKLWKPYWFPLTRSVSVVNAETLLKESPDKSSYTLTQDITPFSPKEIDLFTRHFYATADKKIDPTNILWQLTETTSHTIDANSSIISNVHIVQDIYIGPFNRLLVRDIVLVK